MMKEKSSGDKRHGKEEGRMDDVKKGKVKEENIEDKKWVKTQIDKEKGDDDGPYTDKS